MASFKNLNGKSYSVVITVGAIKRVRNELDIDLMKIIDDMQAFIEKISDPVTLVDILYVLSAKNESEQEFAESLDGGCVEKAMNALIEALADFFPGAKGRLLRAALLRGEQISAESEQKIDGLIAQVLKSAGSQSTE